MTCATSAAALRRIDKIKTGVKRSFISMILKIAWFANLKIDKFPLFHFHLAASYPLFHYFVRKLAFFSKPLWVVAVSP